MSIVLGAAINLARPDEIGGEAAGGCLMITGFEGEPEAVEARRAAVTAVLTSLGGTPQGEEPGQSWVHGRFNAPYLRDALLDVGVLVETLETATFWSNTERLYADVKTALEQALAADAARLLELSRQHWGIENGLHGVRWLTISLDGRNLYASAPASVSVT